MKKSNILFFALPVLFSCQPVADSKDEKGTVKQGSAAESAVVQNEDSTWTVKTSFAELKADPFAGGRIVSIVLNGKNFLIESDINKDNWGSTFWPSPQSQWGWPPSEILDKNSYSFEVEGNSLKMASKEDKKVGYQFSKEITPDPTDSSFIIKYKIANISAETKTVAPWEITRVSPGGITFYPTGKGEKKGDLASLTKDSSGVTWFIYDTETIPDGVPKLLADGSEGWMAQVNKDLMLVKKFKDVPQGKAAPEEAEIELYANPDRSYIEIEQQGEYTELKPGEVLEWEVKWFIRNLSEKEKENLVQTARSIAEN